MAALAIVLGLLLAGPSGAHLTPGDPVHIDFEVEPYVAGGTLIVRLFVSNPGNATADFAWSDGCVLGGLVYSDRRTLWMGPGGACPMVYVTLSVPPDSSVPFVWAMWHFQTRADEGCIKFDVWLNKYYGVVGRSETCPLPAAPPPTPMALTVSTPASMDSAAQFHVTATTRTFDGAPVEGTSVRVTLGSEPVGTAITGPDGIAAVSVRAPAVNATTILSLLVEASKAGWRPASSARPLTIFPASATYLVLQPSLPAGDLVRGEGVAILEIFVHGDEGEVPANASVAVEAEDPLSLTESTMVSPGRYRVTLRAAAVDESRVAAVRLVANAPGYAGSEISVEFVVLPEGASQPGVGEGPRSPSSSIAPLAASTIVVAVGLVASLWVWRRTTRRRSR